MNNNFKFNPLRSVDGVQLIPPSSYVWKLEDVSKPEAGRTEENKMQKLRIGQNIALELSWEKISIEAAGSVLRAFNPEYITVEYLDALSGGIEKKEFYVGNRSAPLFNAKLGLWENISFNIIER